MSNGQIVRVIKAVDLCTFVCRVLYFASVDYISTTDDRRVYRGLCASVCSFSFLSGVIRIFRRLLRHFIGFLGPRRARVALFNTCTFEYSLRECQCQRQDEAARIPGQGRRTSRRASERYISSRSAGVCGHAIATVTRTPMAHRRIRFGPSGVGLKIRSRTWLTLSAVYR
ncbi:uncharacterized protein LOC109504349 [Harpegnathos saltator]|uniref:uncharacterized protein LOC109504349 n=1 Tax=Harpegnathos saltator TaxID=610380 RepID=UPI000DBECEE9|nr:uncharacterized protein LOC109504349 [Harpegnathos saltator]XP_025158040.1 uncharacterized protein LOC109504349 [Harpegnathos saltator]